MSRREIDEYLANLDEPRRGTLQDLRQTIRSIIPEAEEVISYYAKRIAQDVKLPSQFAALVPKVREFLRDRAFDLGQIASPGIGATDEARQERKR